MSEIRNPHDRFFRQTFSRVEIARDFIDHYLPADVVAALDLDSLELQKDSFVDPDLREHFSDLLYQVKLRDGHEANVYFLLEHKSSPDVLVAFQLLRYMVRIWERAHREKISPLPPVIPIVVYHGRESWQVSENFIGLFEGVEALRPYWPNFRYELQDLNQLEETDLRGNLLLKAALLTLMRSFDPAIIDRMVDIFSYMAELPDKDIAVEYLGVVVVYISETIRDVTAKQVSEAINTAFKDDGDKIMGGFVQELIEKGKQEGRQEGQQILIDSTLKLLRVRFDAVSPTITNRLSEISDLKALGELNTAAATVDSLVEFENYLKNL